MSLPRPILRALLLLLLLGTAAIRAHTIHAAASAQTTAPSQTPREPAPSAPILDGLTLFHERGCVQCHTIRGTGGNKGPDLSGVGRRLKKDAIHHQIMQGGGAMPAFGEALPPSEIESLVQYLQHCRDREPRNPRP